MGIRIITDSTSYLPPERLEEYEIEVVPLEITLGGTRFREGEMSNREYYSRLRSTSDFPTTSQPPVGDFVKVFERYGPQETYICLVISELLSGTLHAAESAASLLPDYDITVMDSRSTAMGLGFQVLKAAEMGRQGFGRDQIIQEVVKLRSEVMIRFVVDNLEYLVREAAWERPAVCWAISCRSSRSWVLSMEELTPLKRSEASVVRLRT